MPEDGGTLVAATSAATVPVVRVEGLEPPRLAAPEPKSGASANFAIPAYDLVPYREQ